MGILILSIEILLLAACLVLFVKNKYKLKFCTIFTLISSITALISVFKILANGITQQKFQIFSPLFGDITFCADTLSLFFVLVIAIMSFFAVLYSNGYLKQYI